MDATDFAKLLPLEAPSTFGGFLDAVLEGARQHLAAGGRIDPVAVLLGKWDPHAQAELEVPRLLVYAAQSNFGPDQLGPFGQGLRSFAAQTRAGAVALVDVGWLWDSPTKGRQLLRYPPSSARVRARRVLSCLCEHPHLEGLTRCYVASISVLPPYTLGPLEQLPPEAHGLLFLPQAPVVSERVFS